jgi:oxaloacetate decarboxylase gamma subunit
MEQVSLMQQGIDLMLFGMGTVFTFLVVLIGATVAMSAAVKLVAGKPLVSTLQASASASVSDAGKAEQAEQGELVAVITSAITQHRANKK